MANRLSFKPCRMMSICAGSLKVYASSFTKYSQKTGNVRDIWFCQRMTNIFIEDIVEIYCALNICHSKKHTCVNLLKCWNKISKGRWVLHQLVWLEFLLWQAIVCDIRISVRHPHHLVVIQLRWSLGFSLQTSLKLCNHLRL